MPFSLSCVIVLSAYVCHYYLSFYMWIYIYVYIYIYKYIYMYIAHCALFSEESCQQQSNQWTEFLHHKTTAVFTYLMRFHKDFTGFRLDL